MHLGKIISPILGVDRFQFREGLISIVVSVINSGPNNYYGIDHLHQSSLNTGRA